MSIRLEKVVKAFGDPPVQIIKNVSFEIQDGECVALTGKSGSGKSTLLYMVSSLDNPTSGRVLLQGQDIAQMDQRELHRFRNQHMGFIFQYHYLLPEFSALENVLMPAIKAGVAEKKRDEAIELLKANALNVMQIFQEVNRTNGCTILYVTHDAEFASMAHKQILLLDGQIESITTKSAGTRVQKKRLP